VVLSEALAPFAPLPIVDEGCGGLFRLIEKRPGRAPQNFGRMVAFHGQMGMFTRALAYILSHGADGLRQVAEDAVLNANYILRTLELMCSGLRRSGPCMHEALFSMRAWRRGFETLDIAKGLIDEGYHPMTMYFPLVVHGAMLIEPTETESKAALDQFIQASDPDSVARRSISAWAEEAALSNILLPVDLDASAEEWPTSAASAILCINMTHIAPWAATLGLLKGAARLLRPGAPLILYGPFLRADIETAPSNAAFDAQLRARNPAYGIRWVEDVDRAAEPLSLARTACYPMPANNLVLVYRLS
jgi:hypothetical protein